METSPLSSQSSAMIRIGVKDQHNSKLFFKMKRNGPIRKIWAAFCKRKNLDYRSVTFLLNGTRLRADQTPDELNMNDHDEIDAMKPIFPDVFLEAIPLPSSRGVTVYVVSASRMERRDWIELPVHCLVEVLGRVGIESLVETIPLVCKTWYDATFYPQCWQRLVFTRLPYLRSSKHSVPRLNLEMFLHYAIGRGNGLVTEIVFHPSSRLKEGQIAWMAQQCLALKQLVLPNHLSYVINFEVSDSICSWTHLESLQVPSLIGFKKTIANISRNCPNFNHLSVYVPRLNGDEAAAIASQLPNIKTLDLRFSNIEKEDLVVILKGCKKLEHLDVSECKGVSSDDEILNLARHIHLLDIDDSDLPLTPVLRPYNMHVHETITITSTQNTDGIVQVEETPVSIRKGPAGFVQVEELEKKSVRIIPSPAGIVQLAKIFKQSDIHEGRDESVLWTQEYMKQIVEDVGGDEILTKVTVKDLSRTLLGSIHYKVINESSYGKEITVGSAIILANVLVFSPNSSMHYLNITKKNVVKVLHKNFVHGNGSGVGGSGMLMEEEKIVKVVKEKEMANLELHVCGNMIDQEDLYKFDEEVLDLVLEEKARESRAHEEWLEKCRQKEEEDAEHKRQLLGFHETI
nr:hypothetical protein [Tanacetum cinerariifolium]